MNIEEAYESIKKFNTIGGQLHNPSEESIALQLELIQEEYLEGIEAFDVGDKVEFLDAAIDMFVVVTGLLQKLNVLGYDVGEAMKRVTDNNMSKYIKSTCHDRQFAETNGYNVTLYEYENEIFTVYRDANGKIRKPENFQSVNLSDCVPGETS